MTDETTTPDYATSLHAPGEVLPGGAEPDPEAAADADEANDAEVRRVGYDPDAVSGETDAVRPD
jgi:hypothetical protein